MKKLKLLLVLFLMAVICAAPENPDRITQMDKTRKQLQQQYYEQEFERFLTHLAFKESSGNWTIYNRWGYLGLYQIGYAARKDIGYGHIKFWEFVQDPYIFPVETQQEAVYHLIQHNVKRMQPYSSKYYLLLYSIDGMEINGVKLTLAGMIAGAHLAGAYGMKRYIETRGKFNPRDALGTYLSDYVQEFANYNLNFKL